MSFQMAVAHQSFFEAIGTKIVLVANEALVAMVIKDPFLAYIADASLVHTEAEALGFQEDFFISSFKSVG